MKTIKKSELTRFFDIIANNDLSTKAKVESFVADKQLEATKVGPLTDEGIAIRTEVELINNCLNYLGKIKPKSAVPSFMNDYFQD